jgi:hypothetical protein
MNHKIVQCQKCRMHVYEIKGILYKIELGSSLGLRQHKHRN